MKLSIVIPVYNEDEKIRKDILALSTYLKDNQISGEIIISDDGSIDDTSQISKNTSISTDIPLIVLTQNKHYGKGHAVRKGILQSKGDFVLFMDSGSTVKLDAISKGIELIHNGDYQMILGSRHSPESIITKPLAFHRRVTSFLFKIYIKLFFPSMWGFSDPQCGFKIYDGIIARELYDQSIIDGFLFDIEILRKVKKERMSFWELPIEWTCDRDSRLTILSTFPEVLQDSLKLIMK